MRFAAVCACLLFGCEPAAAVERELGVPVRTARAARHAPVPAVVRLDWQTQDAIDEAVRAGIARGDFPGAVVAVGRRDGIAFLRAWGEPGDVDACYDLASLTKPIVTATSIAILIERGKLRLDEPVSRHLPELRGTEHVATTPRQLLTHTSGLPAILPLERFDRGLGHAVASIARTRRRSEAGQEVLYSDLGFVLLGALIERVTNVPLDVWSREQITSPLGMSRTGFHMGNVHDPRAARLGGVAGHAGLFSAAGDLARFARMMLRGGELDGRRLLAEASVRTLARGARFGEDVRALGWDVADDVHPGNLGRRAFGHGGFTGTSLWIDPDLDLFVVFLANRLHPDGKGAVQPTVERIQALVARAARRGQIAPPRAAPVLTGIDVLVRRGFAPLAGRRVGLLTHRAARARDGRTTAEILAAAPELRLVRLFSPEHGLGADANAAVADSVDPRTNVPVHSLYGSRFSPSPAALESIDTLVVDLQDVGVRFYTYLSTMREAMIAARERGLRFVVLDRPNPLGGELVEGPVADRDRLGFVNHHPLPVRHGMTAGELARLLDAELALDFGGNLEVVKLEGWRREMLWPATGLAWVRPSPNLPSFHAALLYPGVALLETSNVSVGRGTDAPFGRVAAPWMDGAGLARALAAKHLPGVVFAAEPHGVRLRIVDAERVRPVAVGLAIAEELRRLHPEEWQAGRVGDLLADGRALRALLAGESARAITAESERELEAFRRRRAQHLLY